MMAAPEGYFDFPHRSRGLDHERYDMRYLKSAPPMAIGTAALAVWIGVGIDHFPYESAGTPFMPPGGSVRPFPDTWNKTARDYGNRVGIYRMIDALARHGVGGTAFVQAIAAETTPLLVADLVAAGWEIAAGGVGMGHLHHEGLSRQDEADLVARTVAALRAAAPDLAGWRSPAHAESSVTLDLLADAGFAYVSDWVNDDMPYEMRAGGRSITSLPLSHELSDTKILFEQNQSLAAYERQILAAYEVLRTEGSPGDARVLALSLSPWVIGQPYRIAALERILGEILADDGVVAMTGAGIVASTAAARER